MRVGLFGGSFDPPHRGHVALARLAMESAGLGKVLFAPVGLQPLKRDRPQASFADRVEMTELAIAGEQGLELSVIDAPRSDGRPNYTIDTVRALRESLTAADELFCLMGADSFLNIGKWYRSGDLLVACDFVVAARPGFDLGRITSALPSSISVASCDESRRDNLMLCLRGAAHRESRLYLLPHLSEPASASGIRRSLQQGAEPRWDLAPAVAAYIREHGLYKDSRLPDFATPKSAANCRTIETRALIPRMALTETRKMVLAAVAACDDKKGEDTRVLQLDPADSAFTDFFLITSTANDRQSQAIADEIEHRLKHDFGTWPNSVEGRRQGEWILMDYVDFVVHIFLRDRRAFYDLERLRKSARPVDVSELTAALTEKTLAARKKAPVKRAAKKAVTKKGPAKKAAKKTKKRT